MIKIENVNVCGWEAAIRGMRNPYNSWKNSDTTFYNDSGTEYHDIIGNSRPCDTDLDLDADNMIIGCFDTDLMKRLRNSGTDHRKFMRMIVVTLDITAPFYWWKEFDTYKVGTVANSCSTMHTITQKEFDIRDFSTEKLCYNAKFAMKNIVDILNFYRDLYNNWDNKSINETNDAGVVSKRQCWDQLIQLLPSSYNQRRTIMLNYEVLTNMYRSRKYHKLDEWRSFCEWIETLPFAYLITGEE